MSLSSPSSRKITPLLDHIVILIPHSFLAGTGTGDGGDGDGTTTSAAAAPAATAAPPPWFSAPFRFAPGGRHADGRTENQLVLLADGSYLEFIAFVPGVADRGAHRWGRKAEGEVIDWALTLHGDRDEDDDDGGAGDGEIKHGAEFREIQGRVEKAGVGVVYADPVRGGRVRPDGVVLKWAVASAKGEEKGEGENADGWVPLEPGRLPFWCLDETPRRLRVPYEENTELIRHPTGIVGVAEVQVTVGSESGEKDKESLEAVYDAVFRKENRSERGDGWEVETLARKGRHPPGRVVLSSVQHGGKAGDIKITFYTDNENWVGKTIGGKVDDEHTLEFKLVAAAPK